jgi:hypothetical protein
MPGKRVLLVEGKNDEYVVRRICDRLGLVNIKDIRPQAGKAPLLEMLPVQLQESDIAVLGVILDADTDLAASWQSVADRLREAGYQGIEPLPDKNGTILMPPSGSNLLPKIGIWLMPNNCVPGILEDFLQFLVPEGDALLPHARQAIGTLPERRFSDAQESKVLIHTWLAWQEEPGKQYGQAITARYLDTGLPLAKTFTAWLQETFE